MTHSSEKSDHGGILLKYMTRKTVDILRYLDFVLYDKVLFKDNYGISPSEPVRWLGISHWKGRLTFYNILNQTGKVISRSTVQLVTNIELSTEKVK